MDQTKKLNVGDWVRITKVEIKGAYQIVKIELNEYTCVQNEDGYKHMVVVESEELIKL